MFWSKKPERDPTLTELLTRIVELESEWRAFLTQQTRYAARMAKRARDDFAKHASQGGESGGPSAPTAGGPADPKAELRRRALSLRGITPTNRPDRTEGVG